MTDTISQPAADEIARVGAWERQRAIEDVQQTVIKDAAELGNRCVSLYGVKIDTDWSKEALVAAVLLIGRESHRQWGQDPYGK